jgi:hypothetical protein
LSIPYKKIYYFWHISVNIVKSIQQAGNYSIIKKIKLTFRWSSREREEKQLSNPKLD